MPQHTRADSCAFFTKCIEDLDSRFRNVTRVPPPTTHSTPHGSGGTWWGIARGISCRNWRGSWRRNPGGEFVEAFQEGMEEAQEKIGGTLGEEPVVERVCIVLHRSTSFYIALYSLTSY